MRIDEVMSEPVITCHAGDTLEAAARLMWENDCGAIPVVNDNGGLVGMITDRDICMAAYTQGRPLWAIQVSTAMATHVFSCRSTDSVETVERLMSDKQIRRIPVVGAADEPVGIVSVNDLARYAASLRKKEKDGVEHEVVRTLAAICQPRHAVVNTTAVQTPILLMSGQ